SGSDSNRSAGRTSPPAPPQTRSAPPAPLARRPLPPPPPPAPPPCAPRAPTLAPGAIVAGAQLLQQRTSPLAEPGRLAYEGSDGMYLADWDGSHPIGIPRPHSARPS